jgi:hypothetical protein
VRLLVKKRNIAVIVIVAVVAVWIAYSASSQTTQTSQSVSTTSTLACPKTKDLNLQVSTYLREDPASNTYTIYLNITVRNTLRSPFTITGVDVSLLNVTFPDGTILPTNESSSGGDPRFLNPGQWTSIDFTFVSGVKIKSANFFFLIYIQECHAIGIGYTATLPD